MLDLSLDLSTKEKMDSLNLKTAWVKELLTAIKAREPSFNNNIPTNLFLPVRVEGKWLLMVSEPMSRETFVVVFDEWDWNDPRVHEILVHLTGEIKQVTVGMGFKLH